MNPDYIVIGSGIAGLNFALRAAEKGKVLLITKGKLWESNTNLAQGGIAAVLDPQDNAEKHIQDTLAAGAFHNKKKAVKFLIEHSTAAIQRLIDLGVLFNKDGNELALAQEGGHHMRRIAYVADYTGKAIEETLITQVKNNKNIQILEHTFALDLLVKNKICYGVRILKNKKIQNIFAPMTALCTGGVGQVYAFTTNPKIATGDGIAMASRAGAKTQDMEFIQFHPTAFAKGGNPKFLLSEAIRGEGAKLLNSQKERFMPKYHKDAELAPRDIVARAIFAEMKNGPVYLDITHHPKKELQKRFPQIYETLQKNGYDLAKDLIPISPVAHFICGGIATDLHGKTNIQNLFAFGECTYTGVHGANRLASNSLLEGMVFSDQIAKNLPKISNKKIPSFPIPKAPIQKLNTKVIQKKIKDIMWKNAGIIRTKKGLEEALKQLQTLSKQLSFQPAEKSLAETKNLLQVAKLITKAALKRKKSLGCHFRTN